MRTRILPLAILAIFTIFLNSCTKDVVETEEYYYTDAELVTLQKTLNFTETPSDFSPRPLPSHFGQSLNGHPLVNKDKAILGRVLFYDKALSKNEKVSCASCHDQTKAFADPVAFSEGFDGKLTKRNSFALAAVASFSSSYSGSNSIFTGGPGQLFWDNRASTIQEQSMMTLQDPIEMGMNMDEVVNRVKEKDYYKILFNKAFDGKITEENVLNSIAEFISAMVISDTRFDKGLDEKFDIATDFSNFTAAENLGKRLFSDHCAGCHGATHIRVNMQTASNGLDLVYEDKGVGDLTNVIDDHGVFKVPLLRNIELTGPYMHDGRFETLEEVIEHYNSGIEDHRNLHPMLRDGFTGGPKRLNLSSEEQAALVDFLKTLTDTRITTDERFSDPFIN